MNLEQRIQLARCQAELTRCEHHSRCHIGQNMKSLAAALEHNDPTRARQHLEISLAWRRLEQCLQKNREVLDKSTVPAFVADAWFLQDLIDHLTPGPDEEISYVTGPMLGNLRVLSRICPVQLAQQSPVYALATPRSCADALGGILEKGNRLHVMAHSHPGGGAGATHPSSIDINYLGRIQRAGADVVGIIVTRDGYVRFFTVNRPFHALVQGSGIEQVEEYVYRLS